MALSDIDGIERIEFDIGQRDIVIDHDTAPGAIGEVIRRFIFDDGLPDPRSMIVMSMLALAGNVATLLVLQRVRSGEAHIQASWIFTANDIKVNFLVVAPAVGVIVTDSRIPDLVAGGIIFVVVANGARRIVNISR
jgi:Co/Zn/Cd efflux system component